MFGVVAERAVPVAVLLRDAPRSLAALSVEHPDGWGVARREDGDWTIDKSVNQALGCPSFERVARSTRARVVIAHIRKRTVGATALSNTHPFRRGRFVLAHNGTADSQWLARRSSRERLAEIEGDTDSERLFAFVMTRIDEAGDASEGVRVAAAALRGAPEVGAVNFLLSDGVDLHAFRQGRSLYLLRRGADAGCRRARAALVASEPLSAEPWSEVPQSALVQLSVDGLRAPPSPSEGGRGGEMAAPPHQSV